MLQGSWTRSLLLGLGITALAALTLYGMGRVLVCKCGIVRLWSGDITSNQNSQQFFDPYTFTHLIHGVLLYGVAWTLRRDKPPGHRLIWAIAIEAGWEVFENTDFVINRYREATISLDYYGDSVLNSVSDIATMTAGFIVTGRLPVWLTALSAAALDITLLLLIRDSLALNILMLIYPLESVRQWQMG
jgi:hypothetical protein